MLISLNLIFILYEADSPPGPPSQGQVLDTLLQVGASLADVTIVRDNNTLRETYLQFKKKKQQCRTSDGQRRYSVLRHLH